MASGGDLAELKAVVAALLNDVAYLGDGRDEEAVAEAIRMAEYLRSQADRLGRSALMIQRLDWLIQDLKRSAEGEAAPHGVDIYGQVLAVHGAFARQLDYLS